MKKNENSDRLGRFGRLAGRLLWICMILAAIAFVVLAVYGLCATATALDRSEAWAKWVAGVLFVIAWMLAIREMKR